jgi:hypothetical protein
VSSPRGSRGLWSSFVGEYWEKQATLLAGEQASPLPAIEPCELFRATVACTDAFCRGREQKVRLYVDGAEIDILGGAHQAFLPKYEDQSFDEYNRRMVVRHGFQDYALIVADWHQFDRALWERIVVSLEGLAECVGISRSRMDTQVFLGTYKVTPFGVHSDPTGAFHFPVIGTKTMRFWRDSFVANTPELARIRQYERFLQESWAVKAKPGEAIYWPSDLWHVGESDGAFSVTWGFGYWIGNSLRRLAAAKSIKIFEEIGPKTANIAPNGVADAARTLVPVDELLQDLFRNVSSEAFRLSVARSWLEHYSAYGFLKVPSLLDVVPVEEGGIVRKKPAFRILASRTGPNAICIASAGHSCILPPGAEVYAVIDRLNQGTPVPLEELYRSCGERVAINQVIDFCLRSGAVVLENIQA